MARSDSIVVASIRRANSVMLIPFPRGLRAVGDLVQVVVDREPAHAQGRRGLVRGAFEHEESAQLQLADDLDLVLLAHEFDGDAGCRRCARDQVHGQFVDVRREQFLGVAIERGSGVTHRLGRGRSREHERRKLMDRLPPRKVAVDAHRGDRFADRTAHDHGGRAQPPAVRETRLVADPRLQIATPGRGEQQVCGGVADTAVREIAVDGDDGVRQLAQIVHEHFAVGRQGAAERVHERAEQTDQQAPLVGGAPAAVVRCQAVVRHRAGACLRHFCLLRDA
ncbi:MAG: hypothetical protein QM720_01920 [Microbacterium sp.]